MSHICKNCQTVFEGKFCNNCGQKHYTEHDKNFAHIIEETVHFVTHFEGTLPRTAKAILFSPGKLSLDYCNGIRKKYYKPISFFLLLIVLYLLFPILSGLNQPLVYYKSQMLSGPLLSSQIEAKMASMHISFDELSELFHHKSEKISKLFLFVLIPLTVIPLKLLFRKNRRPLFDHFILATEFCSFALLVFFLIFPLLIMPVFQLFGHYNFPDRIVLPVAATILSANLVIAFGKFYDAKWFSAIPKAIACVAIFAFMYQGVYKFLLFEVTIAMVK